MTAPLFLVAPSALAADPVVIDGPEGRHAADVRRLQPGELVTVGDGAGGLVRGVVESVGRGRVVVGVSSREAVPSPDPRYVVVQAVAKGGRDLDAVEAMTEVGVDQVVGWPAARSVARWTDRTLAKWQSTAREAAKQSRRAWVPTVSGPASTPEVAQRLAEAALAVVLHEDATDTLAALVGADDATAGRASSAALPASAVPRGVPATGEVVLVVGPEGGIAPDEVDAFTAAGAHLCRLGPTVLRTSTAGVAALSILSAATRWR